MKLELDDSETEESLDWAEAHRYPQEVEAVKLPVPFTVETDGGILEGDAGDVLVKTPVGYEVFTESTFNYLFTYESSEVPKYSPQDIQEAKREFRKNTLDHVGLNIADTDARAGMRAFCKLLK